MHLCSGVQRSSHVAITTVCVCVCVRSETHAIHDDVIMTESAVRATT